MQIVMLVPLGELGAMPPFGGGVPAYPGHPSQGLPGGGGHPSHGLPHPEYPSTQPPLPPTPGNPSLPIALPPALPAHPIVHPGTPTHPIALPPGVIWPPLPPDVPTGKALVLVAISGIGWRWTVIDTSLSAGWPQPAPK